MRFIKQIYTFICKKKHCRDENDKITRKIHFQHFQIFTGAVAPVGWVGEALLFCIAKRKKGKQREKTVSKQKLLKSCHQGQSITVLANIEHLKFLLSANHGGENTCQCFWAFHFEIHFARHNY